MKSILQNFIEESNDDTVQVAASSVSKDTEIAKVVQSPLAGHMLLGGCNDWENATSKTPAALDSVHRGAKVHKVFSSSSSMHEFVLMKDGSLRAMGRNDHGQLGTGDTTTRALPVSVSFPVGEKILKISTGRSHSLLLTDKGELWGCGANNFGQLGLGNTKTAAKDCLKFVRIPFANPSAKIRDIACGYDFSLVCCWEGHMYSFGHPEYGVLGHGTNGQYIKDGGKGAALQYSCEYTPRRIERFVCKDTHGKVTSTVEASQIRIRAVAAGKNHALCVEEWGASTTSSSSSSSSSAAAASDDEALNRVYSWGWGGYGWGGYGGWGGGWGGGMHGGMIGGLHGGGLGGMHGGGGHR